MQRAVAAAPDDHALRLHLAELLIEAGRRGEAVEHAATVLSADPGSDSARQLMARALTETQESRPGFDWTQAEDDLGEIVPPMFAGTRLPRSQRSRRTTRSSTMTLADVGGMTDVKKRLNAAFLAPMRNEKLRKMYSKSLRGGLLLYGPPGCGKTYIALGPRG